MDIDPEGNSAGKCPFSGGKRGRVNREWWPDRLNIDVLHKQSGVSDPMGEEFDYAKEFQSLDLNAVIRDLHTLMTDSQEWWPADFGHYGPLFIRMAWTAQAHTASRMVVAAPARASNVSRLSIAGRTMPTLTRRAVCFGRSNKNMAARFPGPI